MMKNIYVYMVLLGLLAISCGKEDTPSAKDLATPSLNWLTTNVLEDKLEISITISSMDDLPPGKIELLKDGTVVNNFTPTKGTHSYITNFSFTDTEEHIAVISYSFNDGRPSISKQFKLKKVETQALLKSTKYDWTDL